MKPTQHTLATAEFELHRKRTRRDEFLSQLDHIVPWSQLCALIEPSYPKNEWSTPSVIANAEAIDGA